MFCKWCGKRIKNTTEPCQSCGREQEALINGNCFWDLCDVKDEKKVIPIPTENVQTKEDMMREIPIHMQTYDKNKSIDAKSRISLEVACLSVCIILCILSLVNIFLASNRTGSVKDRLESVCENIDGISDCIEKAVSQINEKLVNA